ncbi:MAG: hypothetical protein QHH17_05325 [Candidatus Bathyarchaeota archaeon]|jgi:hypothetical protein|nr:hypothetical protein [Candidatus Bathyarchaeota archaeon]
MEEASVCMFVFALVLAGLVNVEISQSSFGHRQWFAANKSTVIHLFIQSMFSEHVWVEINVTYDLEHGGF